MPLLDATGRPSDQGILVDAHDKPLRPDQPGGMDLPYQLTFSSIIQGASKSFIALGFDEAMKHNRLNALSMRRDCRIMAWLRERKEEVVSRKWMLEIDDENDPVQVAVRDGMTKIIRAIPRLKRIFRWCLEAIWYGRYGVQLQWREVMMDLPALPQPSLFPLGNDPQSRLQKHLAGGGELQHGPDGQTVEAKALTALRKVTMPMASRPVNGDKINFLWDGTPLLGVYAGWEGSLRKEGADVRKMGELQQPFITWDNEKPVMMLKGEWRERFLIHTHDPDDADYYEAEKAGGVFGVGARSRIYWLNWIRMDYAAWIQDTFDRLGLGFGVVYYDAGNPKAKEAAEALVRKWNRKSVMAIPRSNDGTKTVGGVEIVEAPIAGAQIVQGLIEYADKAIERYMVGQSMSAGETGREGLGGTVGPAEMASDTKMQLVKADAEELEETLTGSAEEPGLCSVIQKWTYPGTIDKFRVRLRFMVEDKDPKPKIDAIVALAGAGVEFGQDSARKLTGEPAPKPGEKTFGGAAAAAAKANPFEKADDEEGEDEDGGKREDKKPDAGGDMP